MFKSYSLLFYFLVVFQYAYAQEKYVLQENFDNNKRNWRLYNHQSNQSKIISGKLKWKYNGSSSLSIANYINRLSSKHDYTVEVLIDSKLPGSESGLIWGAINDNNANYFLLKGKKYKIFRLKDGKYTSVKDYTLNLKIRSDYNLLKIEKKGSKVLYYVNDKLLEELPYSGDLGKLFGVTIWNKGSIEVDKLSIKGRLLPINVASELHYPESPENLGKKINTTFEELTPVISPDGKSLYFSRRFDPKNIGGAGDHQDVYRSELIGERWTEGANLGRPINNGGPNAVFSITPDGNTMLLMNTYRKDGSQKGMGLSLSKRISKGWSVPEDVKMRNFYNKSIYNEFFLSNDNKIILLAVERDDTRGGRDLYVSFNEGDGIWSVPMNMGNKVNTPGTELSPFLASDGKTLYFSSTGHPGYGKNDIFMTRRLDDSWTKWSEPENVGQPVNGTGWDNYYSVPASGEYAYFVSSNRSFGKSDIFKIKLPTKVKPEPVVLVYGKVLNSKTLEPITTDITYRNLVSDKEVGIAQSRVQDGFYQIVLPVNQLYSFFAEKTGFYSVRDNLDLKALNGYKEIERDLYLTPIEIGQTVKLNNVFFVRSKPILKESSYPELDKLANMLLENASLRIELAGHTDNLGSPRLNLDLSEQRVNTVKNYLITKGIAESRISGKGYGGSKPIADNSTEDTRKLNRRVEFKILDY
ncbi:OmpA family protein [Fulvivirgaceae bacterium BMA10]|uniref:OmpA family protein n=1 Tax=Splendidivirga corallicola TaxID=3051826 RepID=A0ABT8KUG2_9BACT|nr:OmpA family protein [Fulvivirgaceae bacterium BMA10]